METGAALVGVGCVASFAFAFSACWTCFGFLRRAKREQRRLSGAFEGDTPIRRVLRNGVSVLLPVCERLCSIPVVCQRAEEVERALLLRGLESNVSNALSLLLCVASFAFLLGGVLGGSLLTGFVLACGVLLAAVYWSRYEKEKVMDSCKEEIPEVLRTMQACFSVGHSLPQTFDQVSKVEDQLLSSLFGEASSVLRAGGTVHESLECLKRGPQSRELSFLATALEIQHRTGSSMQQVLDVTRESIEEDLEMSRSLRTQTAQARLSARIVTAMPFVLVALFSIMSEGFLEPFFESVPGLVMLGVALLMQVAGVVIVRNLLNVEVA